MAAWQDRGWLVPILELLHARAMPGGQLLQGLTLPLVEKAFADASTKLGIKVVPHGMRHGGPSNDAFKHGVAISDIQSRGRWLCAESCRIYMKPASLLRSIQLLSRSQIERASKLGKCAWGSSGFAQQGSAHRIAGK